MKDATSAWLAAARDDLLLIEQIYLNKDLTHLVAFSVMLESRPCT